MLTSAGPLDLLLWVGIPIISAGTAILVISIDPQYVLPVFALIVLLGVLVWRRFDPFWPYLALVAAVQGGLLLQVPMAAGPLQTALPLLGASVLLALFMTGNATRSEQRSRAMPARLPLSLVVLVLIVLLTNVMRGWNSDSFTAAVQGSLTFIQLLVLAYVSIVLLSQPRRVLVVAYVVIASGAVAAVMTLVTQSGALVSGNEFVATEGYARAVGTLTDPNFFSFQLLVPFAFAFHMTFTATSRAERLALIGACVLLVMGILSTYSAGALVGLVAGVGATLMLQLRISLSRGIAPFVAICLVTAVVGVAAPSRYLDVVNAKYAKVTNSTPEKWGTGRGAAWIAGVRAFKGSPVFGVGTATESIQGAIAEHYDQDVVLRKAAHNMYISMAVATGAGGLAAFAALLGSCLVGLWSRFSQASRAHASETLRAVGCLIPPLVVVMTQGLQLDLHLEKYLWLLVGAAIATRGWRISDHADIMS